MLVRLIGIDWGLPGLYEEAYPLKIAWRMLGGDGGPFRLDPQFFRYPSLVIYLQLAVLALVRGFLFLTGTAPDMVSLRALYASDPTVFVVAARSLTAILGALTVLPAFAIAKRAGGQAAAQLASLLVALSPVLVARSQVIDVDIPLTMATTCALALSVRAAETHATHRDVALAVLCGAAAGFAGSAKYPGLVTLVPIMVAFALRTGTTPSRWIREAAVALTSASFVFLATSPYLLIDTRTALYDLKGESIHLRVGHFGSEQGAAWAYYARSWFTASFGWLVGALTLIAIVRFAVVRRECWAVILASFIASTLLMFSLWTMKADRYLLPVVPAGCVLSAVLLVSALRRLTRRELSFVAVVLVATPLALVDVPRWQGVLRRSGTDPRTESAAWIARSVPSGSMLVIEPYGPSLPSPLRGNRESSYWVVPIPLFQVAPERTAVYYDPSLHAQADYWVVTGAVRDRYTREPARFPAQNAFYSWLTVNWVEVARFAPRAGSGSEIVIYRNPAHRVPFASRATPPPLPTELMRKTGAVNGEASFYYALGLNYEGFGHLPEAAVCYRIALSFPVLSGGVRREQLTEGLRRTEPNP